MRIQKMCSRTRSCKLRRGVIDETKLRNVGERERNREGAKIDVKV